MIELILKDTNKPLERRNIVTPFYDAMKQSMGITVSGPVWDIGEPIAPQVDILFGEYLDHDPEPDRETYPADYDFRRQFRLASAAGGKIVKFGDEGFLLPDETVELGAYFGRTGWSMEFLQLQVFVSWHEEPIRKSFEFYKLWMIDWVSEAEMEKIIDERSFSRPLPKDNSA